MAGRNPRVSTYHLALLNALADGQWHDREQIVSHASRFVPPGMAIRSAGMRRRVKGVEDIDQSIRVGARFVISRSLATSPVFETRSQDGRKQVRIRPEKLASTRALYAVSEQ